MNFCVWGFGVGAESGSISKLIVLPIKQVIAPTPPLMPYFDKQ